MSSLPLVTDMGGDVVYGAVDRVAPGLRRVIAENPSKFTYLGTGTYLVGEGEVAVIDPGPALPAHAEAILAALGPGERITHVFVTHTHSDHSPALRLLREAGVDAPAHGFGPHGEVPEDDPTDVVVFGDDVADGKTKTPEEQEAEAKLPPEALREAADTDFVPDVVMGHGDVVAGPGWTIEALHTPGHTSNHLCFAWREPKVLFPGDHVMGWSTSVIGPPDGNLGQYLASLELLLDRDDEVYWPTHGPAITEPEAHVRAFLAHRHERLDQLRAQLADGPADLATMVPRMYAEVPKQLWRPAAATCFAHLLHLAELGEVTTDDDPPRRASTWRLV